MAKAKISKDDLEVLKSRGYVEGNPATIPENLSPVLRHQLIQDWADKQDTPVTGDDLPTAVDRQNQAARERSAADEDGKPAQRGRQGDVAKGE